MDANTKKLVDLCFCYNRKRSNLLGVNNRQLAHYTTADTALKILKGRSMWLRNAGVMNDFSEIEHGKAAIEPVIKGPLGVRLINLLDSIEPGLSRKAMDLHVQHRQHAREAIFMLSLSEHNPNDTLGRLSMWRAYGGPVAGVALLFKRGVVDVEADADLELAAMPVLYGGPDEFHVEFEEMLGCLEAEIDFLKYQGGDIISLITATFLQFAMMTVKHPGFSEEQEWRIIHRPYEFPSAYIAPTTLTIAGIPQAIYEIPFYDEALGGFHTVPELKLNDILDGIIIGPCFYPETLFRAFKDQMEAAGIEDAKDKIFVSNIPLRQQF